MNQPIKQDLEVPPLTRKLRVADIEDNAPRTIEATCPERAAIADLLDLAALDALTFDYCLRRGGGGRVHLSGRLKAAATQTCVVTLEPIEAAIDVAVELEFWPASLVEDLEEKAEEPAHTGPLEWPEAIIDGSIDLGPVIYDSLATALDPYPKKEGASFEWSQPDPASEGRDAGPFAALARLKKP